MSPAAQEILRTLDKVGEDILGCDVTDELLQRISQLEAQLNVQRSLQRTAKLLRAQAHDTALPKQMATRVKHFIKFTFGSTNRGEDRPTRLRGLECNTLKFCGLTYKIKDVLNLPKSHFDYLVSKAEDFVLRHELSQYLYRDEIDKAVYTKVNPEDDTVFKEFLKSHIDQRPAKRKRVGNVQPSMVHPNSQHIGAGRGQQLKNSAEHMMGMAQTTEHYPELSGSSLYQQPFKNASLAFMPILYLPMEFSKYSGLLTSQIEDICGPYLSNAMKASYLWDGSVTTHCFSIAFPTNPLEDAIVVMSISQVAGTQLVNFINSMPSIPSLPGSYIQQEH